MATISVVKLPTVVLIEGPNKHLDNQICYGQPLISAINVGEVK